jgi:hypothetical protein
MDWFHRKMREDLSDRHVLEVISGRRRADRS